MPRVIVVILICALIVFLVQTMIPLPHPFGLLLQIALVVWVVVELLRATGYGWPGRT